MSPKVLIVDDESRMRDLLKLHLQQVFSVETAASGKEALDLLSEKSFDLVVLDVLMPGQDGWSVCQEIRQSFDVPILMLTALSGVEEKLEAFAAGADDYVTKPFDARELIARAQALLRRKGSGASSGSPKGHEPLIFDGLTIDPTGRTVTCDDRPCHLTPMEFNLLYYLASHEGRVFSREELLQNVWKDEAFVETRTVDSHIKTLREKLGRQKWGKALVTVWGIGYKFDPSVDAGNGK